MSGRVSVEIFLTLLARSPTVLTPVSHSGATPVGHSGVRRLTDERLWWYDVWDVLKLCQRELVMQGGVLSVLGQPCGHYSDDPSFPRSLAFGQTANGG